MSDKAWILDLLAERKCVACLVTGGSRAWPASVTLLFGAVVGRASETGAALPLCADHQRRIDDVARVVIPDLERRSDETLKERCREMLQTICTRPQEGERE